MQIMQWRTVSDVSERVLGTLACMACQMPVRVSLSARIKPCAVVQCKTRTILLRQHCGLYDLQLCASLLGRYRQQVRQEAMESVAGSRVREWIRQEQAHLRVQWPGIERFPGVLHPAATGGDLPEIVWEKVEVQPLTVRHLAQGAATGQFLEMPGIQWSGADGDVDAIIASIQSGAVSLEYPPDLGLPMATIPSVLQEVDDWPSHWERMPDDRYVYLHAPIPLKSPEVPADAQFWRKIERVLYTPQPLPDPLACHQGVHIRTAARHLEQAALAGDYAHFGLIYMSSRILSVPGLNTDRPYLERMANGMDSVMKELTERYHDLWDTWVLPRDLCKAARPGRPTAESVEAW
jgi:hypothetical protein